VFVSVSVSAAILAVATTDPSPLNGLLALLVRVANLPHYVASFLACRVHRLFLLPPPRPDFSSLGAGHC